MVEQLQQNVNTVKEIILDENKFLTYSNLSQDLCVHVNVSKQLLKLASEAIQKSNQDVNLNINYIVCGLTHSNNVLTKVCPEIDLVDVKKSFKQVHFEHIYSVSRGVPEVDKVALVAANKFEDFLLCTGLVKSSSCTKRTSDEISNLRTVNQQKLAPIVKTPTNATVIKKKSEDTIVNRSNNKVPTNTTENKMDTYVDTKVKTEPISPKKSSSFNKSKEDSKNKPQKGIAGFFSKQNGKKPTEKPKITEIQNKEAKIKPEIIETKQVKMDIDESSDIENKVEMRKTESKDTKMKSVKESKKNQEKEKTNQSKEKNNKMLDKIKKNAKIDKKRKRVLQVSDSDSEEEKDNIFEDTPVNVETHDSEDEIPPTPTVNTVKITSGIVNPKKRRKIVDKTYTDEDGYILTKKEEVYESCSENEEETATKENVQKPIQAKIEVSPKQNKKTTKNSVKKVTSPQKSKQSTMMNFFKKK